MTFFLAILVIVCIWGLKVAEKGQYYTLPLSVSNVTVLRGALAIEIILGHTYGKIKGTEILYFNSKIGVWVVGLFFFLSGYGLMTSLHKKQGYLDKFITHRILRIVRPVIIVFFLERIYNSGFSIKNIESIFNFFKNMLTEFIFYIFNDWFVCEIIVIYFIWYFLYKFLNEKRHFLFFFFVCSYLIFLAVYFR